MPQYVLRDLVSTTGDLAALPTTVVRLLDLLKDQTCAADKVAQVLDQDGAMTANVLKLSNSAFYGVRGTVGTTRQALVLLGNRAVLTLAFATGMVPVMRRNLTGYGIDRDRYWEHALTSAMTARWSWANWVRRSARVRPSLPAWCTTSACSHSTRTWPPTA
ncbi:MAG: HDOD domain-containing protein [bacterium]|nr:HDOD domain-containing protein [bacterium]